jgi:hypothetical protein
MSVETELAVLTARFNQHEFECNQRMMEVRDNSKETKDEMKKMRELILGLALSIAGGSIAIIVTIVLSTTKLIS